MSWWWFVMLFAILHPTAAPRLVRHLVSTECLGWVGASSSHGTTDDRPSTRRAESDAYRRKYARGGVRLGLFVSRAQGLELCGARRASDGHACRSSWRTVSSLRGKASSYAGDSFSAPVGTTEEALHG